MMATRGYLNAHVRAHDHEVRSIFQADHEGSIPSPAPLPVTRSRP